MCEDGFVDQSTARTLIDELTFVHWQNSAVILKEADGSLHNTYSSSRTSQTCHSKWFHPPMRSILQRLERRLRQGWSIRPDHLEGWQAVRYGPGGKFDFHLDAGSWHDHPAGDRLITIVLYIQCPRSGGATVFKLLDERYAPRAGRLLLWNNLLPNSHPNPAMLHAGEPVRTGTKVILVNWMRERPVAPGRW